MIFQAGVVYLKYWILIGTSVLAFILSPFQAKRVCYNNEQIEPEIGLICYEKISYIFMLFWNALFDIHPQGARVAWELPSY